VNVSPTSALALFIPYLVADKVKAPLPLYNAISVFDDCLPLFISKRILFDVSFIAVREGLILASFDQPPVLILHT
jgi:hypothetical protein